MARLDISSEKLNNYIQKVRERKTPPEFRAQRVPIRTTDTVRITQTPPPKPQEITLHPEPSFEEFTPPISQLGDNLTTLYTLFPNLRELIKQAFEEQKILKGETVRV